jgi:hypothetical protein
MKKMRKENKKHKEIEMKKRWMMVVASGTDC